MSLVIEGIKAMHANVLTGDYGGIREWKSLNLNGYGEEPPAKELNPEAKLMMAVLMDAIETLKRDPRSEQNRRNYAWADAQRWLMSDKDDYCLSFVPICDYFKWDHRWLRKKIIEHMKLAYQERTARPAKLRRRQVRKGWKVGAKKKVRA